MGRKSGNIAVPTNDFLGCVGIRLTTARVVTLNFESVEKQRMRGMSICLSEWDSVPVKRISSLVIAHVFTGDNPIVALSQGDLLAALKYSGRRNLMSQASG